MWIAWRDRTLDRLLKVNPAETLNSTSFPITESATNLAGKIKRTLNQLKIEAISADGHSVDYAKIAASETYQRYRQAFSAQLSNFNPANLHSTAEKLAFWINLYNALIIDAVIFYGGSGPGEQGTVGLFRFFRQAAYNIGGQRLSCEDIEHGILRANRGNPFLPGMQFAKDDPRRRWALAEVDPRIHFALNCASQSCPPVGVYSVDQIETQLNAATQNFLTHDVCLERQSNHLVLSSIFKWYLGDFGGASGLCQFLIDHLPDSPKREWLRRHTGAPDWKFAKYNWGLNQVEKAL